jgi:hypothetical protein
LQASCRKLAGIVSEKKLANVIGCNCVHEFK